MPVVHRIIHENAYGTLYTWSTPHPLPDYPGTDTVFAILFTIPHDLPASIPGFHVIAPTTLSLLPIAPKATASDIPWAEHWTFSFVFDRPEGDGGYRYPAGWLNDRTTMNFLSTTFGTFLQNVVNASRNPAGGTVFVNFRVNNREGIIYPTTTNDPSYPIAPENPSQVCNFILEYTFEWDGPSGGFGNPFNYQDHQGRYHATDGGGSIEYRRSDFGTPAGQSWSAVSTITPPTGRSLHDPRVIVDDRQTVLLSYAQHKTSDDTWDGVYLADSNDDGRTWNTGVLLIEGGKHPTIEVGQDGAFDMVIVAAYVGPDGGPGKITARVKFAGDEDFGDAFNFKDQDGHDLSAADDTFHIRQARDDQSRWMMHALINGESSTTHFSSYDECKTWKAV